MAVWDLTEVCDDIATTLGAATGITVAKSYDELPEGVPDVPCMLVYPEEGATDVMGSTDRSTFRGLKRVTETLFHVDIYCRLRSNLDQDMKAVADVVHNVTDKLEDQKVKSYFGNETIKAFSWDWKRATFIPEGEDRPYVGVRFRIRVTQF